MPTFGGSRGSSASRSPLKVSWIRIRRTGLAGRAAIGPWALGLDLGGQGEQRALVVEAPHELCRPYQLARRDLAAPDQLGFAGGTGEGESGGVRHGRRG